MGDCHSFDPGSNPGPGAYTFSGFQNNTAIRGGNGSINPRFAALQRNDTSPLVENNSLLAEKPDFEDFRRFLVADGRRNTKQVVLYAAKYWHILHSGDVL
jgi:hypothetical protein